MWWLDYLRAGMTSQEPAAAAGLFRIAFAFALILKTFVEIRRGYFNYFDRGSYLYARHRKLNRAPILQPWMNRLQFCARLPAAALLMIGVCPRPALAVLACCLAVELRIYFKYHANLMFLFALILLAAPSRLDILSLASFSGADWNWRAAIAGDLVLRGDPFAQLLVALTMSVVYWATAYRKLNRPFLEGEVVRSHLAYAHEQRGQRRHSDNLIPGRVLQALISEKPVAAMLRRWSMIAVVALEFSLPFALAVPATFQRAALAGLLLHSAFAVLYPGTLLHFSLLSVASYLCFASPASVRDALARLL